MNINKTLAEYQLRICSETKQKIILIWKNKHQRSTFFYYHNCFTVITNLHFQHSDRSVFKHLKLKKNLYPKHLRYQYYRSGVMSMLNTFVIVQIILNIAILILDCVHISPYGKFGNAIFHVYKVKEIRMLSRTLYNILFDA
jgi:hypothetical protein